MKGLTARQRRVLEVIDGVMHERGYPPTIREIGECLNIKSTNGVNDHLKALERKGYLKRDKSKSRAIRLTETGVSAMGSGLPPRRQETFLSVPLVGRIAAGAPIVADENCEATFRVDPALLDRRNPSSSVFILRVSGESMIDAGILDRDLIFVESGDQAQNGEVVAAMIDGEATVKTFFREGDHIRLQPANALMDPIIITASDGRDTRILGRVIGVFRQV